MIINETTWAFVKEHREEDVRQLALTHGSRQPGVDVPMALQQIAGWQTARRKLPTWAATDGIIYPPHLNMEQCSSEQTAKYKGSLTPRSALPLCTFRSKNPSPIGDGDFKGDGDFREEGNLREEGSFVDLTGGFGVDFYWMSQKFKQRIYVERNPELCSIAEHNFRVLGLECSVRCGCAATYLSEMEHADVIYLDPARRNSHGSRTYGIADCTPNVIELLPLLREKADSIILKLSPMLDWRKAVRDLGMVHEVHIVSVCNECKELLLVVKNTPADGLTMVCVNDDSVERFGQISNGVIPVAGTGVFPYLMEPNASIMKAGCFLEVAEKYAVTGISANSHLFVADHEVKGFPGRQFVVEATTSMNKQELKAALQGVDRANVAVRNFPMTAEALRKKLRLKDGGEVFVFGTTLADGAHKLFVCRKIG